MIDSDLRENVCDGKICYILKTVYFGTSQVEEWWEYKDGKYYDSSNSVGLIFVDLSLSWLNLSCLWLKLDLS